MGLNNSDTVSDFTTFYKFKEKRVKQNLSQIKWDEIKSQLKIKNVPIQPEHITIIAATTIESTQKLYVLKNGKNLKKNQVHKKIQILPQPKKMAKNILAIKGRLVR